MTTHGTHPTQDERPADLESSGQRLTVIESVGWIWRHMIAPSLVALVLAAIVCTSPPDQPPTSILNNDPPSYATTTP